MMVRIEIPGTPVAKGRPRFARTGRTYTPAKTAAYERSVSQHAQFAMESQKQTPTKEPVEADIALVFEVPKSYSKKATARALMGAIVPRSVDIDNVTKSILDGLNGVVFDDDGQVVELHVTKAFGKHARAIVRITERFPSVVAEFAA